MSKTRNERRRYDSERRMMAAICLLAVLAAVFALSTVRAFALAAW